MKRNKSESKDIRQRLLERFESDVSGFLEMKRRCEREISDGLAKLHDNYPTDLLQEALSQFETLATEPVLETPTTVDYRRYGARDPETLTTSPVPADTNPAGIHKIPRKRRRRVTRNAVSFADLKQHVLDVIKGFGRTTFTILHVKHAIEEKGVKFVPRQLHAILPNYLTGIEVRGKEKRRGTPLNVYKAKGKVKLRITRTRRSKLPFSELRDKILGVVSGLDSNFTIEDVATVLKKAGFIFTRSHLRVIMCKHIEGIERVSKAGRMNVYKVSGEVCARTKK